MLRISTNKYRKRIFVFRVLLRASKVLHEEFEEKPYAMSQNVTICSTCESTSEALKHYNETIVRGKIETISDTGVSYPFRQRGRF